MHSDPDSGVMSQRGDVDIGSWLGFTMEAAWITPGVVRRMRKAEPWNRGTVCKLLICAGPYPYVVATGTGRR